MMAAFDPPPVFLPYQQRVCADTSKVRVIQKSRRIGLSWALAGDAALDAACRAGSDVFYIGYNREMAEQFISDAAHFIRAFRLIATEVEETFFDDETDDGKETRRILMFVIRFASGHRIHALSSRPQNLRSKQGRLIIDEAAFHHDLGGLLKAGIAFLMWGKGGRVDIVSTHDGVDNEFNALVEDIKAGRRPYSLHTITLADALADGLYERICLVNGDKPTAEGRAQWEREIREFYGADADEELDCIPRRSGGTYIPRGLVEERAIDVPIVRLSLADEFATRSETFRRAWADDWCNDTLLPLLNRLDSERWHTYGQDFGRVSDLSVLAPLEVGQDTRRRVPWLVELRNVPYDEQRFIALYVLGKLPKWKRAAIDGTGNGAYLGEAIAQRYAPQTLRKAHKPDPLHPDRVERVGTAGHGWDRWYAEQLPRFRAAIEDGLLWVPRDDDVIRDICAFRLVDGTPRLPKLKVRQIAPDKGGPKVTRHADAGIAIALAYYASQGPQRRYDGYKSTKEIKRSKGRSERATPNKAAWKHARGGAF